MTFGSASILQNGSSLMRLPAEVRIMILRILLVHTGPIPIQRNVRIEKYKKAVQRSAQTLWTCQQLYREGLPILYGENTLVLHTRNLIGGRAPTSLRKLNLHILDGFVRLPRCIRDLGARESLIDSLMDDSDPENEQGTDMRLVGLYGSLARFSKYELLFGFEDQEHVFVIARSLKDLFLDKHIKVYFGQAVRDGVKSKVAALKSLQYLECASVEFIGYECQELVLAMTSPTVDTFPLWQRFEFDFVPSLPKAYGFTFDKSPECTTSVNEIRQHCLDYDLDSMKISLKKMMREGGPLRDWVGQWLAEQKGMLRLIRLEVDLDQVYRGVAGALHEIMEEPSDDD